jgi:hypothetical protein
MAIKAWSVRGMEVRVAEMWDGRVGGWRLMIFCARATRGLRRIGRERLGALLARGTRTVKLCSFDARAVKGSLGHSLNER